MKTSGQLHGITPEAKAAGATNRLKSGSFGLYAEYFVRYIQAYAEEGVQVDAITLQNEPQFDTASYPCMRMTTDDQIELAKRIGSRFRHKGISTRIFVHDHNWTLHGDDREVIGGDAKLAPVEVVTRILSDPDAGPFVSGSAWHCYAGNASDMRATYTTIRQRFPGKEIYCTELSGWGKNRGPWFGDIRWGLEHNWLGGLEAGASVALEWNLALDHQYGPTLRHDSAAMGLVTVNTDTWRDVKFEREFYAMAHVSLAARPGSRPIRTIITRHGAPALDSPFSALGFVRRDGGRGLFVGNYGSAPETIEVLCDGEAFDCVMPGKSLATLVWCASAPD
jgi:glucosylceramidase